MGDAEDRQKLHCTDLVKKYKKRTVVDHVAISVNQSEIVGLLGPNGAGKTTTFYMIVGLIPAENGRIYLDKTDITSLPMYKRARKGIGYLSQEASVFRNLTVRQNLESILEFYNLKKTERRERADELIEEFNLQTVVNSKGYNLSGGERRRTEIARAMVTKPRFLLLDEPFAGVDPIAVEDIQQIISALKHKNIGILITDHNVHETLAITDRAYLLFEGRILKEGTSDFLAEDKEARKLYLGEQFRLDRYKYETE